PLSRFYQGNPSKPTVHRTRPPARGSNNKTHLFLRNRVINKLGKLIHEPVHIIIGSTFGRTGADTYKATIFIWGSFFLEQTVKYSGSYKTQSKNRKTQPFFIHE